MFVATVNLTNFWINQPNSNQSAEKRSYLKGNERDAKLAKSEIMSFSALLLLGKSSLGIFPLDSHDAKSFSDDSHFLAT
jgi:hypothetical protein